MYKRRKYLNSIETSQISLRDRRIQNLKKQMLEKQNLLRQLEKQEKDFLGTDKLNDDSATIARIEFTATAKNDYLLVPGREETLIPAGKAFTVFGQLNNGRWRCFVDREEQSSYCHGDDKPLYPLIGSVPTSAIAELTQPECRETSVNTRSPTNTSTDVHPDFRSSPINTSGNDSCSCNLTIRDSLPRPPAKRKPSSVTQTVKASPCSTTAASTPASAKPETSISTNKSTTSQNVSRRQLTLTMRTPQNMSASTPCLPVTPTESTIDELNKALERLALLSPRPRMASGDANCCITST